MFVNEPPEPLQTKAVNHRLFSVGSLITIFIVVAIVLILLFPGSQTYVSIGRYGNNADPLTIAYLKASLRSDPRNAQARLALVRQLIAAKAWPEAETELTPLLVHPDQAINIESQILSLEISMSQLSPGGESKDILPQLKNAVADLHILPHSGALQARLEKLIETYAGPIVASNFYRQLANYSKSTGDKRRLLGLAARKQIESGNVLEAAEIYEQSYALGGSEASRLKVANKHLSALLAANAQALAMEAANFYVRKHPTNEALLSRAIRIARQNSRQDKVEVWLSQYINLNANNQKQKEQLLQNLIGSGKYAKAKILADSMNPMSAQLPASINISIARLYEWVGEPEKALALWLAILERQYQKEAETRAIALSMGLNQSQTPYRLLLDKMKRTELADSELENFVAFSIALKDPYSTIDTLQAYRARYPGSRLARRTLIRLHQDNLQYSSALEEDLLFGSLFERSFRESVNHAELLWRLNRPEEALGFLQSMQVQNALPDEAHHYWKLTAELAWFLDELDIAQTAFQALLVSRDKSAVYRAIQVAGVYQDGNLAETASRLGWEEFREPFFLQQLVSLAVTEKDWDLAQHYIDVAKKEAPNLFSNVHFLVLASSTAQHLGNQKSAINYLESAYQIDNQSLAVKQALLWLLVSQSPHENSQLRDYLNLFETNAINQSELWAVMGTGWNVLGNYHIALKWFSLSLENHLMDPMWLAGYADVLDRAGYYADAFKVKQRILQLLEAQSGSDDDPSKKQRLLSLTEQLKGHLAALTKFNPEDVDDPYWLILLMEWALRDGNIEQQSLLTQIAMFRGINLPAWQQLSVAMVRNDREAIEALLRSDHRLPMADKITAARQVGYNAEALTYGLSSLTDELGERELNQVRSIVASIRPELTNGMSLTHDHWSLSELQVNREQLRYARASGNQVYDGYLIRQKPEVSDGNMRDIFDIETQLKLDTKWLNGAESHKLTVDYSQRTADNLLSLKYMRSWQADQRLSGYWEFGSNQRERVSSAHYQLGKTNIARSSVAYQIDRQNQVQFVAGYNQYRSFDGKPLGEGYNWALNWTHQLWFEDPAWLIQLNAQSMQNQLKDQISSRINRFFNNTPTAETFIPEEYCRVGVSSTWQHGQPGQIALTTPSPHYFVTLDSGWQCHTQKTDYAAQTGLGWRIVGDDELSFSWRHASSGFSGEKSQSWQLTYSKYFGR